MSYMCEVVTAWEQVSPVKNEMVIVTAYPLESWSDVTWQPSANLIPDPNVFVARGDVVSDDTMSAVLADTRFIVLWYEELPAELTTNRRAPVGAKPEKDQKADDKPTAGELGKLVSDLAKSGVTGQALVNVLSTAKTRRQNSAEIAAYLRQSPKAR